MYALVSVTYVYIITIFLTAVLMTIATNLVVIILVLTCYHNSPTFVLILIAPFHALPDVGYSSRAAMPA